MACLMKSNIEKRNRKIWFRRIFFYNWWLEEKEKSQGIITLCHCCAEVQVWNNIIKEAFLMGCRLETQLFFNLNFSSLVLILNVWIIKIKREVHTTIICPAVAWKCQATTGNCNRIGFPIIKPYFFYSI